MRHITRRFAFLVAALIMLLVIVLLVMPELRWDASARPSAAENWVAEYVLGQWVRANAPTASNPLPPTPKNLQDGAREYNEHCAVCHGLGGNGENQLGADFYPPVARLSQGLAGRSDGELYFIVSQGIRMTAMPGFGVRHAPDELWKMILWVRHLPHLTPQERAALKARIEDRDTDVVH